MYMMVLMQWVLVESFLFSFPLIAMIMTVIVMLEREENEDHCYIVIDFIIINLSEEER